MSSPKLIVLLQLLSLAACDWHKPQGAKSAGSSGTEFLELIELPGGVLTEGRRDGLLKLARSQTAADAKAAALLYVAAMQKLDGATFSYPLLAEIEDLGSGMSFSLGTRFMLGRQWIAEEMPWKASRLFTGDEKARGIVDLEAVRPSSTFELQVFRKLLDEECSWTKSVRAPVAEPRTGSSEDPEASSAGVTEELVARDAIGAQSPAEVACRRRFTVSELLDVANFDDEDFRRYSSYGDALAGATEEADFGSQPWARVLHAPPWTVRIGAIFGHQLEGDATDEDRASRSGLPIEILSSPLLDSVPAPEQVARALLDRKDISGSFDPNWLESVNPKPDARIVNVQQGALKRLLESLRPSDPSLWLAQESLPVVVSWEQLASAGVSSAFGRVPIANSTFEVTYSQGAMLIVARTDDAQIAVFAASIDTSKALRLRSRVSSGSGWSTFRVFRPNADEPAYVYFEYRHGTAASLYLFVYAFDRTQPLIERFNVPHGVVAIGDATMDGKADLLVSGILERATVDCNQCPGFRGLEIYSGVPLEPIGTVAGISESEVKSASSGGLFSMNADVVLDRIRKVVQTGDDQEAELTNLAKLYEPIANTLHNLNERGEAEAGLTLLEYASRAGLYRAVGEPERQGLDLWKARLLLSAGHYDLAARDFRQLRIVLGNKPEVAIGTSNDLLSLELDLALLENRFSDAEDTLSTIGSRFDTTAQRARYHMALGQKQKAISTLGNLVENAAIKNELTPASVDALVALSVTYAQSQDSVRAHDYLFLAGRLCRSVDFRKCPLVFMNALRIFKPERSGRFALARETLVNLAGAAASSHARQLIVEMLDLDTEVSAERDTVLDHIFSASAQRSPALAYEAAISISKRAESAGELQKAIDWSSRALLMLDVGRKQFTTVREQLEYVDRVEFYWRHFALLRRAKASIAEFVWADETIKLQVLRDTMRAPLERQVGAGVGHAYSFELPSINPAASLAALQRRLRPTDMFVSFQFGEDAGIAIWANGAGASGIVDLDFGQDRCASFTRGVLDKFSLSSASNVKEMRADEISGALESAMRRAGQQFLGRIDLSSASHLLISPDGCQAALPWSAVQLNADESVLDRVAVSLVLPLGERPDSAKRTRQLLIIAAHARPLWEPGSADFDQFGHYPALRSDLEGLYKAYAELGFSSVMFIRDGSNVETGAKQTVDAQLRAMTNASVVHVSSHGRFVSADPGKSALLFSDRGLGHAVTADDIGELDLSKVDLVTLAACESGSLAVHPAGEPVGFVRAAIGAGAESGIFATWQVDDNATDQLFGDFYRELEDESVADALRHAQLASRSKRKHPYYWAGFSLVERF